MIEIAALRAASAMYPVGALLATVVSKCLLVGAAEVIVSTEGRILGPLVRQRGVLACTCMDGADSLEIALG